MLIINSSASGFGKRFEQRRTTLEKARSSRVKRIQQDVQRIAKREVEFSKTLIDEIMPFRLVWNEDAIKKVRDNLPFTFEEKEPLASTDISVDTEVVDY